MAGALSLNEARAEASKYMRRLKNQLWNNSICLAILKAICQGEGSEPDNRNAHSLNANYDADLILSR
jgi:hypothetical protein